MSFLGKNCIITSKFEFKCDFFTVKTLWGGGAGPCHPLIHLGERGIATPPPLHATANILHFTILVKNLYMPLINDDNTTTNQQVLL